MWNYVFVIMKYFSYIRKELLYIEFNKFINMKRKTETELKTINTKNLLRFYKAERNRFYGSGYWCTCGCGEKI